MVLAATSSNTERHHPELDDLILGGSDPGHTSWSQPFSSSTALNSARPDTAAEKSSAYCSHGR